MRRLVRKYIVPHKENDFRPYLLRAAGVAVLLVLIVGAFFGSEVHRLIIRGNDFLASVLPPVLVDLANDDRKSEQLGSLTINPTLEEAARLKAEDMAAKSYFAHVSPDGVTPWHWFSQAGYTFAYAGENLAVYFDDSAAVNDAWMNSPGHRANILNENFTEVGIATAEGQFEGRDTTFVVQMFGRPARAVAVSVSEPAPVLATELEAQPALVEGADVLPIIEPTVLPVIAENTDTGTFVAVQNAQVLAESAPGLFAVSPRYASVLERFITSPTKTLAVAYLVLSIVLLAILFAVLAVDHNRRVRHVVAVLILFAILTGTYYAYRTFTHSEVRLAEVALAS